MPVVKWIDISMPLCPGCRLWPGDRPFEHAFTQRIVDGDPCNVSVFACSAHVGTHIDAPYHVALTGASVDRLEPDIFLGDAVVVEIQTESHITAEMLEQSVKPWPQRLLLKTRNSAPGGALEHGGFDPAYCALNADAAALIARRGLKLLGIDYNSVEPYSQVAEVHRVILGAGIVTLEGLDLRNVQPGPYQLVAVPLRLKDFDGSPVRALLGQV
jgi:arylformamidase